MAHSLPPKDRLSIYIGTVRIDPLFSAPNPARTSRASVAFAPGEKHWHGATTTTAMTHIAIQEHLDSKNVDWMEHVSHEQYQS